MQPSLPALAAAISLAGAASAQPCNPPAAPVCAVSAATGKVVASFPIIKPPFVWRWLRPETQDNDLEYRWQVEFGQCSAEGKFEVGEYAFGVQLFKYPGSSSKSGQLPALLGQAQHTFVTRRLEAGRIVYAMVPEAEVSSRLEGTILQVSATGRDRVIQLLAALPKHALLTVNTPEPGASYTCFAQVEYTR